MFRSNNTEEVINKALSFLVNPSKKKEIKHDNLFQLIVDNVYELSGKK